jgi:prevent-host-death family protein
MWFSVVQWKKAMRQVDIHEAQAHLSQLVDEAAGGEEIVIAKSGKPIARLIALAPTSQPRLAGLLKGKIWVADDFDDPLPEEILADFEGSIRPVRRN